MSKNEPSRNATYSSRHAPKTTPLAASLLDYHVLRDAPHLHRCASAIQRERQVQGLPGKLGEPWASRQQRAPRAPLHPCDTQNNDLPVLHFRDVPDAAELGLDAHNVGGADAMGAEGSALPVDDGLADGSARHLLMTGRVSFSESSPRRRYRSAEGSARRHTMHLSAKTALGCKCRRFMGGKGGGRMAAARRLLCSRASVARRVARLTPAPPLPPVLGFEDDDHHDPDRSSLSSLKRAGTTTTVESGRADHSDRLLSDPATLNLFIDYVSRCEFAVNIFGFRITQGWAFLGALPSLVYWTLRSGFS